MTSRSSTAGEVAYAVRTLVLISLLCGCHAVVSTCLRDPDMACENCTAGPLYDMFNNCSTCVEPRLNSSSGCTECVQENAKCYTGNFSFSALFHSYMNPLHLCGECHEGGPVCCDSLNQTENCDRNCSLRVLFFVRPYKAAALDVELPNGPIDAKPDVIPMFEQGPRVFARTNMSNPYTVELNIWTKRLQVYLVLYDFNTLLKKRIAVDRFLIDLDLGGVPNAKQRETYNGIHNISQFDISFDIKCSDNYYGPTCSTFCSEVGVYKCNATGNKVCADPSCDIGTACQTCTTTTPTSSTGTDSASGLPIPLLGGAIGGVVVVLLLLLLTILLFICMWRRKKHRNHEVLHDPPSKVAKNPQNFENPIYGGETNQEDNHYFKKEEPASKTGTGGSDFERDVDNAIYGKEMPDDQMETVYSQPSNVGPKTAQGDPMGNFGNSKATGELLRKPSRNGAPQSGYAVLDGPSTEYDMPHSSGNPHAHDNQPSRQSHHFENPIYGEESSHQKEAFDEAVGGGYERKFDNVIYGGELTNGVYDKPSQVDPSSASDKKCRNSSRNRPSKTQHRTQPATNAILNGPSSNVYDVTHAPSDPYDVAHPPNGTYDVAHPPNDQYDVAHPPDDQYDVAHPPNDQYDVAHPPNDQYDVAHPPNDQYDVAHPPNDQYDVAHPPNDPYNGALFNSPYDVAHPPIDQSGDYSVASVLLPTGPAKNLPVYAVVKKKK